jgi:hypothetical protein
MQHDMLLSPSRPRWGLGRFLQAAAALGIVLGGAFSATGSGCGKFCDGGFVRMVPGNDQGICEGKCDASKCLAGNTCVDNHCELQCTSHNDCDTSTQDCVPAREDDTNKSVNVCANTGKAPIGAKCPFGNECMGLNACPDGSACDFTQCGGATCAPDTNTCGDDKTCKAGLCPDKTPCTVPGCTMDKCTPLVCVGAGQADANAFCTMNECSGDVDCPGGYYCATVHDPHAICNSTAMKGNNNFCGKTTEMCVDLTKAGPTFSEGQYCLLHTQCRLRRECVSCSTDLDCSYIPGAHCTTVSGAQVCTKDCKVDTDCDQSFECKDGKSCTPRFGACKGMGDMTYCDPCTSDLDCGDKSSKFACVSLSANEHSCLDISFSTSCMSDTDCPVGPDGHHGTCLNETYQSMPGDATYHKCYAQLNTANNKASCWCGKAGGECLLAKECCSNKCNGADPNNGVVGKCG